MSMSYDEVVKRLKEERCRLSLSQEDMARYIRTNQSSYSKVELAFRRMNYYELKYLCDTEVDVYYIFTAQRCDKRYLDLLAGCSYLEMVCCLNMIFAISSFYAREEESHQWKQIYERLKYLSISEESQSTNNIWLAIRHSLDWKQQTMAEKLGIDIKKFRDLEKGRSMPDSELLYRVYEEFKIPPYFVLEDINGIKSEVSLLLGMLDTESVNKVCEILRLFRHI